MFPSESFIMDVVAISKFILNEQIAWRRITRIAKSNVFFLSFFLTTRDSDCYLLS